MTDSSALEVFRRNAHRRIEELGLKRSDVAKRMGVVASSVYMWLGEGKAVKDPSLPVIEKFAIALEMPCWELLRPREETASAWTAAEPSSRSHSDPVSRRIAEIVEELPDEKKQWLLELLEGPSRQ